MTVLVVRPAPACFELVVMLEQNAISAMAAPFLSFAAGSDLDFFVNDIDTLPTQTIVIAISPRAVEFAHQALQAKSKTWRTDLQYIAVGDKTAQSWLHLAAIQAIIPEQENSEGVLALGIFNQPNALNIVILRGDGGRDFLAQNLTQLGAKVQYFEVYQRLWDTNAAITQSKLWQQKAVKTLIVTSGEQLRLLWQSAEQATQVWLTDCPLFVPSNRIYHQAKQLGFKRVFNVDSANNQALLNELYKTKILDNSNDRDQN